MSDEKKVKAGWQPIPPERLRVNLEECPFCHGGELTIAENEKSPHLIRITHLPDRGVNCPARYEQYGDSQEQVASWWNDRSIKNPPDLPEPPDDSEARLLKISKTPPALLKPKKLTAKEYAIKKLIDP